MSAPYGVEWLTADALWDQLEQASGASGFEKRPQQRRMAIAVDAAFKGPHHLLVEAGTGTGKTLAYLAPAVLSQQQVIISTATKNLQEQLLLKDVPLLRERTGLEVDAALLKGRQNYLCLLRFDAFEARATFASPDEAIHWQRLQQWAEHTETGDRGETELPDDWAPWEKLSTRSEECRGQKCPLYESCFVTRARARAAEAKLVVVSHALFFADLALRSRPEMAELGLGVLPRYQAVVFDEAHALEDVATEHFGVTASSGRLMTLGNDAAAHIPGANPLLTGLGLKLKDLTHDFFEKLGDALEMPEESDKRMSPEQRDAVAVASAPLREILGAIEVAAHDETPFHPFELDAIERRAAQAREAFETLGQGATEEPWVYWARRKGRGTVLKAAPVEVGATLDRTLYQDVDTVVFTSATLSDAPLNARPTEEAFSFIARRFGLTGRQYAQLRVNSPFDYAKQAALYLPNLQPPNSAAFLEQALEQVRRLVRLTHGRAFLLFTSLRQMETFHRRLEPEFSADYQVLLQGERPRRALLEDFVSEPSVLFASQSFWEGVDVPGEALSLVVVDRLPFSPPDEPLNAARVESLERQGIDAFEHHQLPQAALSLRQGFGRLIRTAHDRGVMALLDSRVRTKRYGRFFLDRLPPATRFMDLDPLIRWYQNP